MTEGVAQLGLVLDCADPERLAEFWAPALGYVNLGAAGAYVPLFDLHPVLETGLGSATRWSRSLGPGVPLGSDPEGKERTLRRRPAERPS